VSSQLQDTRNTRIQKNSVTQIGNNSRRG